MRYKAGKNAICEPLLLLLNPSYCNNNIRTHHRQSTILLLNNKTADLNTIMKVKILAYHAVAAWQWDLPEDDLCGICRVQFDGTCPKCKFPGDDCPVVSGECAHSFHMHCLDTWINQESSQGKCPMCRQVFKIKGSASVDNASTPAPVAVEAAAT